MADIFFRLGDATYTKDSVDPRWTYMHFVVETAKLSALYHNVLYRTATEEYILAVRVDAGKMTTSMSVTFYQGAGDAKPSCAKASLSAVSHYEGGSVDVTSLTSGEPIDVLNAVNEVVTSGFLNNINGGGEDLLISATSYALTLVCS